MLCFVAAKLYLSDMHYVIRTLEINAKKIVCLNNYFVQAVIEAEDHRFLTHYGVDFYGIYRAIYFTCIHRKLQGASTIEQQLVRTILKDYRLCLRRKFKEIAISVMVNTRFSKDFLAKAYVYYGYYGWKMSGIDLAMKRVNITNDVLTLADAARLIAMLKYPLPRVLTDSRVAKISMRAAHIIRKCEKKCGRNEKSF